MNEKYLTEELSRAINRIRNNYYTEENTNKEILNRGILNTLYKIMQTIDSNESRIWYDAVESIRIINNIKISRMTSFIHGVSYNIIDLTNNEVIMSIKIQLEPSKVHIKYLDAYGEQQSLSCY